MRMWHVCHSRGSGNLKKWMPACAGMTIIIILLYAVSWAAEAGDISSFPVEVNGDQVQYFESEKKVVGEGNVVVTYKDVKMTCKKVTAYLDSKEATAEGDAVVTRGEDVLKGERIVYNFQAETGVVTNGVARSGVLYGGGKEINKVSPQELDIKDGYITTCDLAKPHYAIRSRQVRIYLGKRVVAKNVTFNVGGVPILYLPVYSQPVKEKFPKVSIVPGHDKKWGTYLLSAYRYDLTEGMKGNLHLDYRQFKGIGEGVDYNFKTKNFGRGYVRGYYMNERDKVAHTERERWRAQYRHKWQMRPDTTAVLEYNKIKDGNFIKDYFYREEFEREPQPKTYVSVIHARPAYIASILAEKRVNKFFTETERLPDAELNIKNQRVIEGLPFFYKGAIGAANLDNEVASSTQVNNVMRADTYNQLSIPLRLVDFLSVDPYVATRQSFYTRELDTDKSRFRGALYSGVDLSANFYRIYDYKTNFLNLDINGVRHIFTPNVNYYYIQKPTLQPGRLFEFDDIDSLDQKKGIGFALENKLQTRRLEKNEFYTADLARWLVDADYFIHSGEERNRLSDIGSDLELRPSSWLFVKQTALFDPKWKDLKSLNTDVAANDPKDKWRLGLGHRYEEKASSQLTAELEAKVTPKWKGRIFGIYEFRGGSLKQQEYSITRDLHCWEAEFTYSVRDVNTFWIIFHLKAFPELPLKLGTSYYRPRTGSSGGSHIE